MGSKHVNGRNVRAERALAQALAHRGRAVAQLMQLANLAMTAQMHAEQGQPLEVNVNGVSRVLKGVELADFAMGRLAELAQMFNSLVMGTAIDIVGQVQQGSHEIVPNGQGGFTFRPAKPPLEDANLGDPS